MSGVVYLGWDIGGAHLKMAQLDGSGRIIKVEQHATPLWQGMESLVSALARIRMQLSASDLVHAVTITGELSDFFENRRQGIEALLSEFCRVFPAERVHVYAASAGFLPVSEAMHQYARVASANWHATASFVARQVRDCLLVDIGSTTTDLVPVMEGLVCNRGFSDQQRMQEDELLYTGVSRTPVMAVVRRVLFDRHWQSVAAEHFATMADVYRITGELDESHDLLPAADGGGKQVIDSVRRLARMVGSDVAIQKGTDSYRRLAEYIAEVHLASIARSMHRVLNKGPTAAIRHIVAAGTGRKLAAKLAFRHNYQYTDIESLLMLSSNRSARAADCATAVSVAYLRIVE